MKYTRADVKGFLYKAREGTNLEAFSGNIYTQTSNFLRGTVVSAFSD